MVVGSDSNVNTYLPRVPNLWSAAFLDTTYLSHYTDQR